MKKSLIVIGATVFAVSATSSIALAAGTGAKGSAATTTTTSTDTASTPTSDARMAQQVRDALAKETALSSQAKTLRVSSNNGSVTVSGTVANEQERSKVESVARQAAGEQVTMDVAVE